MTSVESNLEEKRTLLGKQLTLGYKKINSLNAKTRKVKAAQGFVMMKRDKINREIEEYMKKLMKALDVLKEEFEDNLKLLVDEKVAELETEFEEIQNDVCMLMEICVEAENTLRMGNEHLLDRHSDTLVTSFNLLFETDESIVDYDNMIVMDFKPYDLENVLVRKGLGYIVTCDTNTSPPLSPYMAHSSTQTIPGSCKHNATQTPSVDPYLTRTRRPVPQPFIPQPMPYNNMLISRPNYMPYFQPGTTYYGLPTNIRQNGNVNGNFEGRMTAASYMNPTEMSRHYRQAPFVPQIPIEPEVQPTENQSMYELQKEYADAIIKKLTAGGTDTYRPLFATDLSNTETVLNTKDGTLQRRQHPVEAGNTANTSSVDLDTSLRSESERSSKKPPRPPVSKTIDRVLNSSLLNSQVTSPTPLTSTPVVENRARSKSFSSRFSPTATSETKDPKPSDSSYFQMPKSIQELKDLQRSSSPSETEAVGNNSIEGNHHQKTEIELQMEQPWRNQNDTKKEEQSWRNPDNTKKEEQPWRNLDNAKKEDQPWMNQDNTKKEEQPWRNLENTKKEEKPWRNLENTKKEEQPWKNLENTKKEEQPWRNSNITTKEESKCKSEDLPDVIIQKVEYMEITHHGHKSNKSANESWDEDCLIIYDPHSSRNKDGGDAHNDVEIIDLTSANREAIKVDQQDQKPTWKQNENSEAKKPKMSDSGISQDMCSSSEIWQADSGIRNIDMDEKKGKNDPQEKNRASYINSETGQVKSINLTQFKSIFEKHIEQNEHLPRTGQVRSGVKSRPTSESYCPGSQVTEKEPTPTMPTLTQITPVPVKPNFAITKDLEVSVLYTVGKPYVTDPYSDGLRFPIGVNITSDGDILVNDTSCHLVKRFRKDVLVTFMGAGDVQLQRPSAIVVNQHDDIFIKDDKAIHKFSKSGQYEYSFGKEDLRSPYGLVMTDENTLLVLDLQRASARLFEYKQTGELLSSYLYQPLERPHMLTKCRFMAYHNHQLLVSDLGASEMYLTSKKGEIIRVFGRRGNGRGEFNEPSGITVDSNGNWIVADSRNNRLQVFNAHGDYVSMIKFKQPIIRPSDIHLTPDGHLYIVDFLAHMVKVYDLNQS